MFHSAVIPLQAIKNDHKSVGDRFTALLEKWLKKDPKLDELLEALRSPVLDQGIMADELEMSVKSGKIILWE